MASLRSRPRTGFALVLGLAGLAWLGGAPTAQAGDPELEAIAAERGMAPGALEVGSRVVVRAGSPLRAELAERRSLRLHGLPVRGGFQTLWRAAAGVDDRVVAARYPAAPPQLLPDEVRVPSQQARDALVAHFAGVRPAASLEQLDGELVYLLILDRPVLAWEFTTPLRPPTRADPRPRRERVWISAASGRVLEVEDRIFFANLAEVYPINPQHTPEPVVVELGNIDPEPEPWLEGMVIEGQQLTGTRVRVFNCVDEENGPVASWREEDEEDECFPIQQVTADENGDFFVTLPDVKSVADNKDATDLYAELSMYFHAERFFAVLEQKGVEGFPCELSNMVANFHWLEPSPGYPELDYGPYNNAYYSGVCEIEKGPTMLFGQGSAVDFAFDGDVVYHELGHGIVQHLTPEGLRSYKTREDGVLRDARALNEAIADYHTLMLTDRPELADYVGFYWPELDRAWIRNAENEQLCPRDMAGQEHNDSEPFTAALWAARRRIGGDKLDPVVLGALPLLGPDASIEEASAALLEVAAAEREAGLWTAADMEQLTRALQGRGLIDCPRVVDTAILDGEDPRFLYLRSNSNGVTPFWPGPVQYRHVVPEGSDNLLISFESSVKGNSAGQPVEHDVEPRVLLKRSSVSADAPIHFEYTLTGQGYSTPDKDDVDEVTLVEGDWDEVYLPTRLSEERRQILIRGLEPGEVLHLAFANPERETTVVRELLFASVPTDELDEGSPGEGRAEDPAVEDDGSSCACATPGAGGSSGAPAIGLLMLASLGLRRRRSTRPPSP